MFWHIAILFIINSNFFTEDETENPKNNKFISLKMEPVKLLMACLLTMYDQMT